MRAPIRKRDLLRRIEALEARLGQPTPRPLEGQQTIPLEDDDGDDLPTPQPHP